MPWVFTKKNCKARNYQDLIFSHQFSLAEEPCKLFYLMLLDQIDMSEVDKLLAKAKSVRVSTEPTERRTQSHAFAAKDSSIKTMKGNPKGLFVDCFKVLFWFH